MAVTLKTDDELKLQLVAAEARLQALEQANDAEKEALVEFSQMATERLQAEVDLIESTSRSIIQKMGDHFASLMANLTSQRTKLEAVNQRIREKRATQAAEIAELQAKIWSTQERAASYRQQMPENQKAVEANRREREAEHQRQLKYLRQCEQGSIGQAQNFLCEEQKWVANWQQKLAQLPQEREEWIDRMKKGEVDYLLTGTFPCSRLTDDSHLAPGTRPWPLQNQRDNLKWKVDGLIPNLDYAKKYHTFPLEEHHVKCCSAFTGTDLSRCPHAAFDRLKGRVQELVRSTP